MADLYTTKQRFYLGAYKSIVESPLPDESSSEYHAVLTYKARAYLALNDTKSALQLVSEGTENPALKAIGSLARYLASEGSGDTEAALEELRDIAVEIEGDDVEESEEDKALVRMLAATAFTRAGEVEEALETLGTDTESLEAVAVIVQIYLSINRPDLAKKQFDRSKNWAEDDLLLQLIESNIGLVTGKDNYSNTYSFYTEQIGNPSLVSPHLLTARGITRILRGDVQESKSDLEESLSQQPDDVETQAAYVVAAELGALKRPEADELWAKFASQHPAHPMVVEHNAKSELFDQSAVNFPLPPAASTVSA